MVAMKRTIGLLPMREDVCSTEQNQHQTRRLRVAQKHLGFLPKCLLSINIADKREACPRSGHFSQYGLIQISTIWLQTGLERIFAYFPDATPCFTG
jgi:hypothetical protein